MAVVLILIGLPTITKSASRYYALINPTPNLASTTATFIIGGTSTTTKTFDSDGYEQATFLVAMASSSTPPTLCWKTQYSDNAVDWYSEDYTYASSTSHLSPDPQSCWLYSTTTALGTNIISQGRDGVTTFLSRKIVIPNLDTNYTRTQFSISSQNRAMLDVRVVRKNTVITSK